MTMYVRAVDQITLTISSQDHDDDVLLDGTKPFAVLPLWAAQKPEFQELWADERVEVATDTAFVNLITEIPASELPGTGSIPTSLHVEEIVDYEGHVVLRLADGTVAPGTPSNYLVVTNSHTGGSPSIKVEGTVDTNANLELSSLGSGMVVVKNDEGTMLELWGANDAVHHLAIANASAGNPVEFGVVGQAGNVDINAYPMGTGRFNVNQAPVITGVQKVNGQGQPRWSYNSPTNSLGQYAVQENSLAVGLPNPTWAADILAAPGDYVISFNDGPQDVPITSISGPGAGTNVYTLTGTWPANATGFPLTIAHVAPQSYALTPTDLGSLVTVDSDDPFIVTIPSGYFTNLIGARIELSQIGIGVVTVVVGDPTTALLVKSGTVVQRDGNDNVVAAALSGRGGTATLTLVATNTWLLTGDLLTDDPAPT
jgi:hypothetical protein